MITRIYRRKWKEPEMVNKVNSINYINIYLLSFSASLEGKKLYEVIIITMHSWVCDINVICIIIMVQKCKRGHRAM